MAVSLPTDDLFSQQWYLHNTVTGQCDLDVVSVWNDYTGKGVKVMVMDNGFDHEHVDLKPNYDFTDSYDYGAGDTDAAPDDNDYAAEGVTDDHGTAVMGIIGAARNGVGVVGAAYEATLVGASIRYEDTPDDWASKYDHALSDAVSEGVGVINMSFGGASDYDNYDGQTNIASEMAAVQDAVDHGRDGLGIALVKSAGNSRSYDIDVNHNQDDNNTNQIIVAAVNNDGFVSNYSSYGTPILISAFGSPSGSLGGGASIVTTDRTGTAGYSAGDYDTAFNGTSAAAPQVSGIVALMLQANPGLGWRDIQTILADTARHVGSVVDGTTIAYDGVTRFEKHAWNWNDATNWNGGGMHYNEDYGYGLVDARAAVRLAENWNAVSTSDNQKSASVTLLDTATPVPDDNTDGLVLTPAAMTKSINVERVTVSMDIDSQWVPDLAVYLTGPDGHKYALSVNQSSGDGAYTGTFTYHSQAYRGMLSTAGDWTVQLVDNANLNYTTTISNVTVTAYGSAVSKANTYVYTDEFSDSVADGSHSHSANLKDTNGGVDTLNAAAVATGSTVDLSKGTGMIDGVAMKISGIENVDGGDGKDQLTGSKGANILSGGRGADALAGSGGSDEFLYHTVADSLDGKGHDTISDFIKGDIIDLSDIDTKSKDGDQAFSFIGGKAFSGKAAQLDVDLVDKKGTVHDVTLVYADLDGDKAPDFEIQLNGLHTLTKGDFIL